AELSLYLTQLPTFARQGLLKLPLLGCSPLLHQLLQPVLGYPPVGDELFKPWRKRCGRRADPRGVPREVPGVQVNLDGGKPPQDLLQPRLVYLDRGRAAGDAEVEFRSPALGQTTPDARLRPTPVVVTGVGLARFDLLPQPGQGGQPLARPRPALHIAPLLE